MKSSGCILSNGKAAKDLSCSDTDGKRGKYRNREISKVDTAVMQAWMGQSSRGGKK